QARGAAMRAAGLPFADLTGIFRDHPEPLYVDTCCHLNRAGYELLARRIAATIRCAFDLQGVELKQLRAAPPRLQFDDPVQVLTLAVVGVDSGGQEYDVSEAAFGTAIAADPGAVAIAPDGGVRALVRGSSQIAVRRADLRLAVPVAADWPDVVVAADGVGA